MITFDAVRLSGLTDIDLPILGAAQAEPFQVKAIDGLGPPELDVLIAEDHAPGGIYINRRAQGREIVVRIGLNPDYRSGQSVGDLRYMLYGLLSPGPDPFDQALTFKLMRNGMPVAEVQCYIKRFEIVPFDREPQAQITMHCLGPYLNKPDITEVSNIPEDGSWTLTNSGLAPTGIQFEVTFIDDVNAFSIEVQNGNSMFFTSDFLYGDSLIVDTSEASRFVGHKRGEDYLAYLEILSPESDWIILHGGEHTIITSDTTEFNWVYFTYRTRYWGI